MGPIGEWVLRSCIAEVSAPKAGNVHRHADFADMTYIDFVLSAAMIAPVLDRAVGQPLGGTILDAIRATRRVTSVNTNLGIVLLLAPLASVPLGNDLRHGVAQLLGRTTLRDTVALYEAIALAMPGGMGRVDDNDVRDVPTLPLREVMLLAQDRDWIARQYATNFAGLFDHAIPLLQECQPVVSCLDDLIVEWQLRWLAEVPDTLIERKRGHGVAREVSRRAMEVRDDRSGWSAFDAWLREPNAGRNPGTTADIVTAALFVGYREGWLHPYNSSEG